MVINETVAKITMRFDDLLSSNDISVYLRQSLKLLK